jgi:hypothetical protein
MSERREIATAPRDGTRVRGYWIKVGRDGTRRRVRRVVHWVRDTDPFDPASVEEYWAEVHGDNPWPVTPTHWTPLSG